MFSVSLGSITAVYIDHHQDLGSSFIPFVCDVSQREDLYKTCHKILQQGLCPQVFFLNAVFAR